MSVPKPKYPVAVAVAVRGPGVEAVDSPFRAVAAVDHALAVEAAATHSEVAGSVGSAEVAAATKWVVAAG